jgi:hypothetical protein
MDMYTLKKYRDSHTAIASKPVPAGECVRTIKQAASTRARGGERINEYAGA